MLLGLLLAAVFVALFSGVALALAARGWAGQEDTGAAGALLRQDRLSTIRFWAKLLAEVGFVSHIKVRAQEAQLDWSLGRITALMLLSGAVGYVLLSRFAWLPAVVQGCGAALAALLPYLYILRRRARRFTRFEEEFPEALDSMCRALRAGHPIPAALEVLVSESEPPVSTEMGRVLEEWRLGKPLDQALEDLAARLPLEAVALFVGAVKLSTRMGGRLGHVLGNLAETVREANALRGEVRALSAHGRVSATTLTLLPVLIALGIYWVHPSHLEILFRHPLGRYMVTAVAACIVLAHLIMRRIVDIRP